MSLTQDQIFGLLAAPGKTLKDIQVYRAETSLRHYVQLMWPVLEPGRRLATGWALDAMCDHLEGVTAGHIQKLLINVPPGCMKSLLTNVFWPAWEWGPKNRPAERYISASYNQALTIRDNRRCRNLLVSPQYQALWGKRFAFIEDQNTKVKFENDKTGWKQASAAGSVTGERGSRFIIDDPHSVQSAESEAERESTLFWLAEVVPTRVADPDVDPFIIIMQRLAERDASGFVLAAELGYTHLCLPMEYDEFHPYKWKGDPRTQTGQLLWPERFTQKSVDELKKTLRAWGGTYAEAGQLQQLPVARGGGMFKEKWFNIIEVCPRGGRAVRAWDLASSTKKNSPWTVGVKLRRVGGRYVIEDVVRIQGTPHQVKELIKATAIKDGKGVEIDIPQDPGQAGKAQVHDFVQMLDGWVVHTSPESGSKEDRARPFAAQAEGGNVDIVEAPWTAAYINELKLFPRGQFMDQADATSRAHAAHLRKPEQTTAGGPVLLKRRDYDE